jgi:hypothetical protein
VTSDFSDKPKDERFELTKQKSIEMIHWPHLMPDSLVRMKTVHKEKDL